MRPLEVVGGDRSGDSSQGGWGPASTSLLLVGGAADGAVLGGVDRVYGLEVCRVEVGRHDWFLV